MTESTLSLFSKYDATECLLVGLMAHSSQSPVVQKTCPICLSHLISSVILVGLVVVEVLLTERVLFCNWSYWIAREKLRGDGRYVLLLPGRRLTASWNKVGFMYNKFICESDTLTRWSVITRWCQSILDPHVVCQTKRHFQNCTTNFREKKGNWIKLMYLLSWHSLRIVMVIC